MMCFFDPFIVLSWWNVANALDESWTRYSKGTIIAKYNEIRYNAQKGLIQFYSHFGVKKNTTCVDFGFNYCEMQRCAMQRFEYLYNSDITILMLSSLISVVKHDMTWYRISYGNVPCPITFIAKYREIDILIGNLITYVYHKSTNIQHKHVPESRPNLKHISTLSRPRPQVPFAFRCTTASPTIRPSITRASMRHRPRPSLTSRPPTRRRVLRPPQQPRSGRATAMLTPVCAVMACTSRQHRSRPNSTSRSSSRRPVSTAIKMTIITNSSSTRSGRRPGRRRHRRRPPSTAAISCWCPDIQVPQPTTPRPVRQKCSTHGFEGRIAVWITFICFRLRLPTKEKQQQHKICTI